MDGKDTILLKVEHEESQMTKTTMPYMGCFLFRGGRGAQPLDNSEGCGTGGYIRVEASYGFCVEVQMCSEWL